MLKLKLHLVKIPADINSSFAFVEYESRRDADDAYHEMHNKRIGRDDLLKIEVRKNTGLEECSDKKAVGAHPSISFVALRYRP